jgi:DNA-binding transcriptional ArsR family regulator
VYAVRVQAQPVPLCGRDGVLGVPGGDWWPGGLVAGRPVSGTAARVVLAVLEAGPLCARDIAAQTGITMPTVKDVLRRLRRQGIVAAGGSYNRPVYQLARPSQRSPS